MDLREYPIGEEQIPAQQATCEQLRMEADRTEDPRIGSRLMDAANWREFFEDFHNRIISGLEEQMNDINLDLVKKLLDWEKQSAVENSLKEGSGPPFPGGTL